MAAPAMSLSVLDHARELFARELVSHVGVRGADMLLGVVQHLVLRLAADRLAARAIDHLCHWHLLKRSLRSRHQGQTSFTPPARAGRAPRAPLPARRLSSTGRS